MNALSEKDIRIMLVKQFIKIIEEDTTDPRREEALEFYNDQLRKLENIEPQDIIISLKPGSLVGKALGGL